MKLVKRALGLFMQSKHRIDKRHQFALALLQESAVLVSKIFDSIAVEYLPCMNYPVLPAFNVDHIYKNQFTNLYTMFQMRDFTNDPDEILSYLDDMDGTFPCETFDLGNKPDTSEIWIT